MTAYKKETAFSQKQLDGFRSRLDLLRQEALREIQSRIADKREQDHNKVGGDIQDLASDETGRELSFLMTGRDRQKIMMIDTALQCIETGDYGLCEECEEAIGIRRLQAMPFTRYCVACQEEIEEMDRMAQQRDLEEEEKQYIEFAMAEPDQIDDA